MESSASFPMWLSSTLKTREKTCHQTSKTCVSKLNMDTQTPVLPAITPTSSSEENFVHEHHSELILNKMNQYFKIGKLKDVTLIAGKKLSILINNYLICNYNDFLRRKTH